MLFLKGKTCVCAILLRFSISDSGWLVSQERCTNANLAIAPKSVTQLHQKVLHSIVPIADFSCDRIVMIQSTARLYLKQSVHQIISETGQWSLMPISQNCTKKHRTKKCRRFVVKFNITFNSSGLEWI